MDGLSLHMDASYLILSLLWSTVGGGFWIYGKKQRSAPPMFGGIAMIGATFLITTAVSLSVVEILFIIGIYFWSKQSD